MLEEIRREYQKSRQKADDLRKSLRELETGSPKDSYEITITRDRLAYWEGMAEGLKFALERIGTSRGNENQ